MANNKRILKKEIRTICGALAGECVIAKITVPGICSKTLDEIIYKLADTQESALALINFDFPQAAKSFASKKEYADARHAYYKAGFAKLKADFNSRIDAIVKEMNAALPAAQKEANKEAVAK